MYIYGSTLALVYGDRQYLVVEKETCPTKRLSQSVLLMWNCDVSDLCICPPI